MESLYTGSSLNVLKQRDAQFWADIFAGQLANDLISNHEVTGHSAVNNPQLWTADK